MANVLVQMLLSIDSESRLLDKQTTQTFRIYRNGNEDLVFKLRFNIEFDNRLCRAKVRYRQKHRIADIIVKVK